MNIIPFMLVFYCLAVSSGCRFTPKTEESNSNGAHIEIPRISDSVNIDTQWISDKAFRLIRGKDTIELYRKIGFSKTFKDYPVKIFNGAKMPLNYCSHWIARKYKTVITNHYKKGEVNFAGHYIIAGWRCGAPCFDFAIVDVKTGDVYYPNMMNLGYFDYKPDSKLFVMSPQDSLGWYPTINIYPNTPSYYLWDNNHMKLIWEEPGLPLE